MLLAEKIDGASSEIVLCDGAGDGGIDTAVRECEVDGVQESDRLRLAVSFLPHGFAMA
jgi:hypothetical protein